MSAQGQPQSAAPAVKREDDDTCQPAWGDVESIFNPPKHDFASNSPRRSPPRFIGKRRKTGEHKNAPSDVRSSPTEGDAKPAAEEQEPYPIKFSLSQDIRDDGSFSEYFRDGGFLGSSPKASPRGSPSLGPSLSFGFTSSPVNIQGTDTFEFDPNQNGFPLPKLQMSPLATPPRNGTKLNTGNDLKPESPPTIKKPMGKGGNHQLPPPRFPTELVHSQGDEYGSQDRTPISTLPRKDPASPYRAPYAGPTQHQSPGQTIYNVPSTSVGSPPSPYQPYRWQQPPASHPASHSTPRSMAPVAGHEGGTETSPEFNPPRGHLRGQSRSHATTIAVKAPLSDNGSNGDKNGKKLDPITPSPGHTIRQAVSDESPTSPSMLAPTVHQPPSTHHHGPPPGLGTPNGGWSESLHMAPLPPYVAQSAHPHPHQPWGPHHMPPAMPSSSGYPPQGYYSPHHQYYGSGPYATPDQAQSSHTEAPGSRPDPAIVSEQADWRKHHHLLHQFLLQFGHCNVPEGYGIGTHYEGLFRWCNEQRTQYQRMQRNINREAVGSDGEGGSIEPCTMTPTRARILTQMGFVWGHPPSGFRPSRHASSGRHATQSSGSGNSATKSYSSWDKWMELLADYRSRHGDCDVPLKYEGNPSLGTFVNRQRAEYKKLRSGKPSSMTQERIEDLERLGLTWAVRDSHTSWSDRFEELKGFKEQNGHCNVPKIYSKNPSLGYWVNEQRFQYRRLLKKKPSYMTQEKIDRLNELEFKWSLRETNGSWENWLKELREYRQQHGDVDVPLKYRPNPALGAFVNRQRTEYRKLQQGLQTSLTEERMRDLGELGFKWAIRVGRTPWDTRLEELKKFKEQHGHCNVPSTYPKNQPLAYWVFKQRGQYRIYKKRNYPTLPGEKRQMCHMTPDRIAKLDAIGFEWSPPRRINCPN